MQNRLWTLGPSEIMYSACGICFPVAFVKESMVFGACVEWRAWIGREESRRRHTKDSNANIMGNEVWKSSRACHLFSSLVLF